MISIQNILWVQSKKAMHCKIGLVESQFGRRRVALLYDENANPLKPKGTPPLARPFTLEVHLPVIIGTDKVLKFTSESAAKSEADRQLSRFIADVTKEFSK